MKIQELDTGQYPFPYEAQVHRSTGWHVTEIIYDMYNRLFGKGKNTEQNPNLLDFEKGFLWERVLESTFRERCPVRVGEVELDGISCSPDGVDIEESGERYVAEYKATLLSSSKTPETRWAWMAQVKAYCHVLGLTTAIFHVFYIAGDYKGSGAQYKVFRVEFTKLELLENWEAIVNHKRLMEREGNNQCQNI